MEIAFRAVETVLIYSHRILVSEIDRDALHARNGQTVRGGSEKKHKPVAMLVVSLQISTPLSVNPLRVATLHKPLKCLERLITDMMFDPL